jgi:hypothetical protein
MVEADACEFGKSDGQDREIDATDSKAEREEADNRAAGDRDQDRHRHADPGANPEMHIKRSGRVGAETDIKRMPE